MSYTGKSCVDLPVSQSWDEVKPAADAVKKKPPGRRKPAPKDKPDAPIAAPAAEKPGDQHEPDEEAAAAARLLYELRRIRGVASIIYPGR